MGTVSILKTEIDATRDPKGKPNKQQGEDNG